MAKETSSLTAQVLAGFRGPTVWNGEMARLMPALTFKDVLPQEVKQIMNMSTPTQGKMHDPWVIRRPGSSMK